MQERAIFYICTKRARLIPITPGQSDYLKTVSKGEVNYETWFGNFFVLFCLPTEE